MKSDTTGPKDGPDLRGLRLFRPQWVALSHLLKSEGRPRFEGIETLLEILKSPAYCH